MTILLTIVLVVAVIALVVQTGRLRHRERALDEAARGLAEQEPMAHLGTMMAGIAHELNTPVGAIHCSVDTRRRGLEKLDAELAALQGMEPGDPAAAGHVERAARLLGVVRGTDDVLDQALGRTGALLRHLRLAGRGERDSREAVDLNEVVDGALLLLNNALKQGVTVHRERGELPPVEGNASSLGSVVINLLENARQAVGGEGEIFVRTFARDSQVGVSVADAGPGLPDCRQERERIFDPGYTTKGRDEGTGLGLFIARKVANGHGGTLKAGDRSGGGAEFTLLLPAGAGEGAGGR